MITELAVVLIGVVAAVLSWGNGLRETVFAASGDVPEYIATRYVGAWLLLSATLTLLVGVIAIDAITRTIRSIRSETSPPALTPQCDRP